MQNPKWTIREERGLRGYCVEWAARDGLILSRRDRIYRTANLGTPRERLGRFPGKGWKRCAARGRWLQRLLRYLFYNVVKLRDDSLFLTFDKGVGRWSNGRVEPISGLVRPTRVLRSACAVDDSGDVYFGEYVTNAARHEIHVYRYVPGREDLEIVHTFPPKYCRHVHGVYYDQYGDCLWCVTGDQGNECRILRTFDGFNSVEVVGEGDESWRCVSLVFTPQNIYYGSDAEFSQNFLYKVDRETGERTKLDEIDGPVYYSRAVDGDLFFGVTAELCPSQRGKEASLWWLRDGESACRVAASDKDMLPVKYFLAGTWYFPQGPGIPDGLLLHGVGLRGADNRTFTLQKR